MTVNIVTRGDIDPKAIAQMARCAEGVPVLAAGVAADGHYGYSQPVGGWIAYLEHISPSGVGYDIGCGNKAVRTNIRAEDIDVARVMDEIFERISFGVGRKNNEPVDHAVFDRIREADFAPQRQFLDMAASQLGTVGSGNHYVDLFSDEDGWLWIGVHFGSRGFGHKTASGFLALAEGKRFEEHATEGEMDSPPVLFAINSDLGQAYISAMQLAGEVAYAGRDVVVDKVLEIVGAESTYEVHNHHNFAWKETHSGIDAWVVRKGCTPAFPGQQGFVGATMGEPSVILEGVESEGSRELLYSTVHGAGRVMSRTEAAGKKRKRWYCRLCGWEQGPGVQSPVSGRPEQSACPSCRKSGPKVLNRKLITLKEGKIDWQQAQADLIASNIELRGAGADEAPGAYKRLDEVLGYHSDTVHVIHQLTPIGVAMAGADTDDPFKD